MPLDDDLNAALSPLHFGFTAPMWGGAIQLQISRIKPVEDLAIRQISAWKAIQAGNPSADHLAAQAEFEAALAIDPEADRAFLVLLHPTVSRDAVFLVIAIRGLLSAAEQMASQASALGKGAALKAAVVRFTNAQPLAKRFRDVIIHFDEYAVGGGRDRGKATKPEEGMGVGQDDDGRIHVTWGGHTMNLLQAAEDALTLWRDLNREFWGKLHTSTQELPVKDEPAQ
ncbi:hypothetical protein ACIA98_06185 [Streptomyces sp. NPDC051366]|uniref:hypothetical protein n=1 Tax=Streptomyces sp. NPDC051366 TaxID=3365652 RepID=UPI003790A913